MREVYYLCAVKTKINTPLMYEVLDKDTIKFGILPYLSVAKRGYVTKSDLSEVIQCILYKLKTSFLWHIMRKKVKRTSSCFLCSYVSMDMFVPKLER